MAARLRLLFFELVSSVWFLRRKQPVLQGLGLRPHPDLSGLMGATAEDESKHERREARNEGQDHPDDAQGDKHQPEHREE